MTATIDTVTTTTEPTFVDLAPVDLYKDIHKGIRAALFALVGRAGSLDAGDGAARGDLAAEVHRVAGLLDSHAAHEDAHCQPALEVCSPALAAVIAGEHAHLDARVAAFLRLADAVAGTDGAPARAAVHTLYLELADFTGEYLRHQDFEERRVMRALATAMPVEDVVAVHQAIVSSIPPDEMAASLAIMLPAMNVDDRTELLGGIREGAPAEVFAGVCALTESVLAPSDWSAVAARLGVG